MSTIEEADDERPFVNEECGDTMWDAVLADHEARLAQQKLRLDMNQPVADLPVTTEKPNASSH
ncbi:hypothetical protein GCM10028818_11090 [Spirosoma horti]